MPRPKSPVRLDWLDPAVCSVDYRLKIIGRLPFFRHLPAEAITDINRLFEDRDIAAEQAIYFEGDSGDHLYLVAIGKVKLMRHAASGQEVLLDILHGGDYFGNLSILRAGGYGETAIAQTDCCILQISTQNFEKILERHPDVMMKVLKAVGQRLEESREIIEQLSVYTVEQRVAAALIRLAKKLGEQKAQAVLIQLPFSRRDLAAMTATTTETVSRVVSHFTAEGWVSTGRKWIVINDLARLEAFIEKTAVN